MMNRKALVLLLGIAVAVGIVVWLEMDSHTEASASVAASTAQLAPRPSPATRPASSDPLVPRRLPDARAVMEREAASNPDEKVRVLSRDLLDKYSHHDELERAYDKLHEQYVERFTQKAPKGELENFQFQLDDLMEERKESAQEIYRATTKWNDAFVSERMAALNLREQKGP
jgi:hypothetical protein